MTRQIGHFLAAPALWLATSPTLAADGMHGAAADWWAPLDHYCERTGPEFWAEPLNAVTNIGFVVAAALVARRQLATGRPDHALMALAALATSVGVGSFLFHTVANGWTLIADIVPIAVFIYTFVFVATQRLLGFGAIGAGLLTAALLALAPALQMLLEPVLGASATYAPGLVATFGIGAAAVRRGPAARLLIAAGGTFVLALIFREMDQPLCGELPSGTHFLWHTFNAVTVGLALLSVQQASARTRPDLSRRAALAR